MKRQGRRAPGGDSWGFGAIGPPARHRRQTLLGTTMTYLTATPTVHASQLKSRLVDIGLEALSRGDWTIVMAITTLIRNRGWGHE
jgi:hypothetical protein